MQLKLLTDEMMPTDLSTFFPASITVTHVEEMHWKGTRNGALLKLAAEHGFDAMLTADKNMRYQQNEKQLPLPIIVLSAQVIKDEEALDLLVPKLVELFEGGLEKQFYFVS